MLSYHNRYFTFENEPTLAKIDALLKPLSESVLSTHFQQISEKIVALAPGHASVLRKELEECAAGLAETIDSRIEELKRAKQILHELRPQVQVERRAHAMMMCGLYTYWAHSKDVEAPAGISVTAIERQFGRLPTWHAEGSLTTDFPCPTCGQVAQLHAAPSIKNRGVLLLQCAACGHQTERTIWDERETYQKLKCTCEACMTTVAKTAESVAPLARRLGANLATFCSDSATREIARMQALPVTADKRRTPAGVSAQAMLGRTDSPYDTCLAIFNQG